MTRAPSQIGDGIDQVTGLHPVVKRRSTRLLVPEIGQPPYHTVGFAGFAPCTIGAVRDQICTTYAPKVKCVTFDERVVVHRVACHGTKRTTSPLPAG